MLRTLFGKLVLPRLRSVALNGDSHDLVALPSVLLKAGNFAGQM